MPTLHPRTFLPCFICPMSKNRSMLFAALCLCVVFRPLVAVEVFEGQPVVTGQVYLLAVWDFNDTESFESVRAVSYGAGTLSTDFPVDSFPSNAGIRTYSGSAINAPFEDPAGEALALVNVANNGGSITLEVSCLNFRDLGVSYATRGTATGFSHQIWSWSLDGVAFMDFLTVSDRVESHFSRQVVDFSAVGELQDRESVWLRVRFEGATSSTGNNRLDNLVVQGAAIVGEVGS